MSKYNNAKCELKFQSEVYSFDSKLEAAEASRLFSLLKKGEITNLILQKKFILCEPTHLLTNSTKNGKTKQSAVTYISDFTFNDAKGRYIVSDSKGVKTATYSLKKRLLLNQLEHHGIDEFHEVYKAETIIYKRK